MICEACGDEGTWSGCAVLCPPCEEAIHARDTAPEVRMEERDVLREFFLALAWELYDAIKQNKEEHESGVLCAVRDSLRYRDPLAHLGTDAADWERHASDPGEKDPETCRRLATYSRIAAERMREALAAAKVAAGEPSPHVGADGVCEACEAMPEGADGRAPWCAYHRTHPTVPTEAA